MKSKDYGIIVFTKVLPWTNTQPQRIQASCKRDSQTTWRHFRATGGGSLKMEDHASVAVELVARFFDHFSGDVVCVGSDADHYYFSVIAR